MPGLHQGRRKRGTVTAHTAVDANGERVMRPDFGTQAPRLYLLRAACILAPAGEPVRDAVRDWSRGWI